MPNERIIKAREKRNNGQIIEERKIAADDKKKLKRDEQDAGNVPCCSRPERKPGHDQFDEVVPSRLEFEQPMRRKMQVTADRVWDRLRFIVIIKTGEIAPAGVAAQFDQAGAKHDPKAKPAKKPDHQNRRPGLWKRPAVEQWTKKNRQEPRLEQLDFPAVAVPDPGRCEQSTCTSPKGLLIELRWHTRRERRATARTQPRRKSTNALSEIPNQKSVGTRSAPALREPSCV